MTRSERLQWAAIGAAIVAAIISLILGYSSISQNEEFKVSDLSSRIGVLEERTRTLDIAAIKRELESIKRDQTLLVTKSVNQERFSIIEKKLQSFGLQLGAFEETSSNVNVRKLADIVIDQHLEKIRGPKGEKGAVGERGPTGSTGAKGPQGAAGVRGQSGENSSAAAVENGVFADDIDRYIKEAVAKTVKALPVAKVENTAISTIPEGKIFASGDCVELNPLKKSISANLAFGGSICLDGVPYATISHTNGCSYFSMSTDKRPGGVAISIGKRLAIAVAEREITIQPGCKKKDRLWYYPTRIFWSSN